MVHLISRGLGASSSLLSYASLIIVVALTYIHTVMSMHCNTDDSYDIKTFVTDGKKMFSDQQKSSWSQIQNICQTQLAKKKGNRRPPKKVVIDILFHMGCLLHASLWEHSKASVLRTS